MTLISDYAFLLCEATRARLLLANPHFISLSMNIKCSIVRSGSLPGTLNTDQTKQQVSM